MLSDNGIVYTCKFSVSDSLLCYGGAILKIMFSGDFGKLEKFIFLFIVVSIVFATIRYSGEITIEQLMKKHAVLPKESSTFVGDVAPEPPSGLRP